MDTPPAFAPVFRMEVFHQYLAGGAYSDFAVSPIGETKKMLDRFGLIGAQAGNQFSLYADGSRMRAFAQPDGQTAFAALDLIFVAKFRDTNFARYTDLPWSEGSLLLFTNRSPTPGRHRRRLTAGPFVSAGDLYPVHPGGFQFQTPKSAAASTPRWVLDSGGKKIIRLPDPVNGQVTVDLGPLAKGCHSIEQGTRKIYRFFSSEGIFLFPPHALIVISGAQMLRCITIAADPGSAAGGGPSSPPVVHTLTFPSRATVWRYDIFNHGAANPKEFSVATGLNGPPVSFARVPGIAGAGGEISIAFESVSSRPIPLQARPPQRFQLLRQKRVVLDPLPTPGLTLGRSAKGRALRSEMFVYL